MIMSVKKTGVGGRCAKDNDMNRHGMKVPIRGSSPPPSTVCRLVGFTGGVKGILVQYAYG